MALLKAPILTLSLEVQTWYVQWLFPPGKRNDGGNYLFTAVVFMEHFGLVNRVTFALDNGLHPV